jgi:hypothetical protein
MVDILQSHSDDATSPARQCFAITPHDTNKLPVVTKGIRACGDGTVTFQAIDSDTDVAHPVYDGERIDVRVEYVRATGTDIDLIGYA